MYLFGGEPSIYIIDCFAISIMILRVLVVQCHYLVYIYILYMCEMLPRTLRCPHGNFEFRLWIHYCETVYTTKKTKSVVSTISKLSKPALYKQILDFLINFNISFQKYTHTPWGIMPYTHHLVPPGGKQVSAFLPWTIQDSGLPWWGVFHRRLVSRGSLYGHWRIFSI